MKRVTVVNNKLQEKLSHKQQILSLIFIVTFPYLKNKLAQLSLRYKLQEIDGCGSREASSKNITIIYIFFLNCVIYMVVRKRQQEEAFPKFWQRKEKKINYENHNQNFTTKS